MDPLSEFLSLISTQSAIFAGLKAGNEWAIDFPPPDGIKFNAIVTGACWLLVDGHEQAVRLESGDCFLLSRHLKFSLRSDLDFPSIPAKDIYCHAINGVACHGSGDSFFLIGGLFAFGSEARLLLDGLPPVTVIRRGSNQASVLNWALQRISHELGTPSPGSMIVTQHLGHIMLVHVLRIFMTQGEAGTPNWLHAISDPRIGPVIHAIHAEPSRHWTLEDLAQVAGVSRSTLALRFKQKSGIAPLEYVSRWRMQLAARSLKANNATISSIAQSLGYESDSAFSHAFKRIMKCSPREYRHKVMAAPQP